MVLTPPNPTMFDSFISEPTGNKVELVIDDHKAKDNLWKNIVPVNSILNKNKIDFAQTKELVIQFLNQYTIKKKDVFARVNTVQMLTCFVVGSKKLLEYSPTRISVELTSGLSISFFAVVNSKNIYYEIFFDEQTGNFATSAVNIYENKQQKLASVGSFPKVFAEMDEHVIDISNSYINYIFVGNEVSGSPAPQYSF